MKGNIKSQLAEKCVKMKHKRMSSRIGEILSSNSCGDFEILSTLKNSRTLVRFLNTANVAEFSNWNIVCGNIKDPSIRGKIYGVGICDVNYNISRTEEVNGKRKVMWICPYYKKWSGILERCYSEAFHKKHPTYKDCTICEEWKYLSNFIKWVDSQPNRDWQNCSPDKDLLIVGNKIYSPETTVFVSKEVNCFLVDSKIRRGDTMIWSHVTPCGKKWRSQCSDNFTKSKGYIGVFDTEMEAHLAGKAKKHEYACQLADLQDDPRVADALRQRYAPDKDWSKY